MAVAPQLNEDLFGTKVFTITFTIRDARNSVDRTDAGYLEVTADGGATITGNGTNTLTITGKQSQCNTAMANLNYVPSADFTEDVGLSYAQVNDSDAATHNDFMVLSNRDTHPEVFATTSFTYNEDEILVMNWDGSGDGKGPITDVRGDTLPDTQYTVTLTPSDPSAGVLDPSVITGTKAEVNAILSNITFTPSADYTDNFTIQYNQNQDTDNIDQGGPVSNVSVGNTHDEFSINSTEYTYNEDEILAFNVGSITDLRPDNIDSNIQYQVVLVLSDTNAGTISPSVITGTKAEVNAILQNITFTPSADYNQNFDITYSQQQTTDSVSQGSAVINMNIGVTHDEFVTNDTEYSYNEDEMLIMNIGAITDLRPDNIDSSIQYQVDLGLSDPSAGVFSQNPITGTKTEVNNALSNIVFTPSADYNQNFDITYSQQQTTDSVSQGSAFIDMNIGNTHDEFVTNDTEYSYNEDEILVMNIGAITDLRPDNIDADIQYQVDLGLSDPSAGVFSQNPITGTKQQVNAILQNITFTPSADYKQNFDITYSQQQTTDSVSQGSAGINMNIGVTHDEFVLNNGQIDYTYYQGETLELNIGAITDLRPDNIDADIQYQVDLGLSDPSAGVLTPNVITGTKAEVNAILQNITFSQGETYVDKCIILYTQQQTTDGVDQGSSTGLELVANSLRSEGELREMIRNGEDVSYVDTRLISDFSYMFDDETSFNQDISGWDVSSGTNFRYMFNRATSFNQDISGWDVSSGTNFGGMFRGATAFNQDISGWDVSSGTYFGGMFNGATAFNQDLNSWDVSSVTSFESMFEGASNFNQDLNSWDVSNGSRVRAFADMFNGATSFNGDISSWVVSGVTRFERMFNGATSFNQDISGWDVSSGTYFGDMFRGASSFNQDISGWDVSSGTNFGGMFSEATSFDQNISGWDVSSGTYFGTMFSEATSFNQNISGWDVSSGTYFGGMFSGATSFNGDISSWDVSSGTDFGLMFNRASSFNQDLNSWDVSSGTDFGDMFQGATSFNGDISSWDVSSGTDFGFMFIGATSFNQDISGWDVSSGTYFGGMFEGASNFNQDLNSWDVSGGTYFWHMFDRASSFNGDISSWVVSNGTDFGNMFTGASSFNGDISSWDVSSGRYFRAMFTGASSFNQDIGSWDVSSVTDFGGMFDRATSFNQDISGWDTISALNWTDFRADCPLLDEYTPAKFL